MKTCLCLITALMTAALPGALAQGESPDGFGTPDYFVDSFNGPDIDPRWTNDNSPSNPADSDITIVIGRAESITNYMNCYNHLQTNIRTDGDFYVELESRTHHAQTWGAGLVVYFDPTHFIGLKAPKGSPFRCEFYDGAAFITINSSKTYPGWSFATMRIEFGSDTIRFYAKNEGEADFTHLDSLDIPRAEWTEHTNAFLIVGKGYQSDVYTGLDYDNDYANTQGSDNLYMDNVKYLPLTAPVPPNVTFYASFDTSLDADYAGGDGIAWAVPGASGLPATGAQARLYFGNAIDFGKPLDNLAVRYAAAENIDQNRGSVEFWWKPRYGSEINGGEVIFYAGADSTHYIRFEKAWGGANGMYGRLIYKNGTGQLVAGGYCSKYYPETWQHIVLDWDSLTTEISFYINGYRAALAAGFVPLSAEQLGDWFYFNGCPDLTYWGGCCIDEVIIRDGPHELTSPYATPLAARNAAQEQIDQAAAEDEAVQEPAAVSKARNARVGIVMDIADMIPAMYSDEASYAAYIQEMAAHGVTELTLRVSDMGNFMYFTQLEQLAVFPENPIMENVIHSFDQLQALVEYGHAAGMRVSVWHTMFDEGYYPPVEYGGDPSFEVGGWVQSKVIPDNPWARYTIFARNNPDKLWRHRDGRQSALALSYAYPEVRAYRIALLEETMDYGIDGIILDATRWPWVDGRYLSGIYDNDNITQMGYEQPIIDAWAADENNPPIAAVVNSDPNWLRLRADMSMTQLLRELKPITEARGVELGVVVSGRNNLGYSLSDVEAWFEEQLIDVICPSSKESGPAISLPWRWYGITKEWVDLANGRVTVIPSMPCAWLDQDNLSIPMFSTVFKAGAAGFILYEAQSVRHAHHTAIETLKRMDLLGNTADLNADGVVNLIDFVQLCGSWRDDNCAEPYWCNGADLIPSKDGSVNFLDLANFAHDWLEYQQH